MHVFDVFKRTIGGLPPKAFLKALDRECKMLEYDLETDRLSVPEDALSIVCFRQFVRTVKDGKAMHCVKPLPPDHTEFFKTLVVKLIDAKELPSTAMDLFDYTFLSIFTVREGSR